MADQPDPQTPSEVAEVHREVAERMRAEGRPESVIAATLEMFADAHAELDPELEPYVYTDPLFGRTLKHPLVFMVPLSLPGMANKAFAAKEESLAAAVENRDWARVVWLHERPYRLQAFVEYVVGTDDDGTPHRLVDQPAEVQALAARIWTDSENIGELTGEWAALFSGWAPGDPMLFNDDPDGWAALPEELTVYRAGIDDGGWSWTLDPAVAEFFAARFDAAHPMLQGTVAKTQVFGYLTSRSEAEVLVLDGAVGDLRPYAGAGRRRGARR